MTRENLRADAVAGLTVALVAIPQSLAYAQLADVPGRDEPGNGEINFDFLLAHIDRLGYAGWMGCEYNPRGDTVQGLKWAKSYL